MALCLPNRSPVLCGCSATLSLVSRLQAPSLSLCNDLLSSDNSPLWYYLSRLASDTIHPPNRLWIALEKVHEGFINSRAVFIENQFDRRIVFHASLRGESDTVSVAHCSSKLIWWDSEITLQPPFGFESLHLLLRWNNKYPEVQHQTLNVAVILPSANERQINAKSFFILETPWLKKN